ncbi:MULTISPECIES: heparinase II/III domain-containing protein [unclassified Flavobacterium]|uniref:heparinase II/III domain-containing protein n=1 Tax=unclassified Flavobacterium TaxID=196869 RepID=UPI0025BFB1A6|nr:MULTISPECIES: heparinase II/III family protein [unclassified Flavobacterium]
MKKSNRLKGIAFIVVAIMGLLPCATFAQTESPRKSLFLTETERARLKNAPSTSPTAVLLTSMQARVYKRANSPSFDDKTATTEWWHHASEYLTDAALIHAIRPSEKLDAWLRASILDIIRRPNADWTGPGFRGYDGGEIFGTLETAHLAWGIGVAYDMSSDLFSPSETQEIKLALREKGLIPCKKYLDKINFFHNWNCVLLAGYSVAATILEDDKAIDAANSWLPVAIDHFQTDGSYGESLQYGNYAAYSIMIAQEALLRYDTNKGKKKTITLNPYGKIVNWASYALLYRKPLSGWPIMDWPRSVNFGDCGSIFRPSGDLLVHIATRGKNEMPQEAGLASWLFNTLYFPANEPGPHDLASFGFVNDFGFLSVIMLADMAPPISPTEAKLPLTKSFTGGDTFARDAWVGGLTTLASRVPGIERHAVAHVHGDINSFMLIHNKERLLVDPGHTTYRNIDRDLDISSETHNTCTFETVKNGDIPARKLIQVMSNKNGGTNRPLLHTGDLPVGTPPVDLAGRHLLTSKVGNVSVIASDAAALYGAPLRDFSRFLILCGSHSLFVVDHIVADEPIKTTWNFLLNNRDGLLDFQLNRSSNSISAQRGNAGITINHYANDKMVGPIYALMHDAYHVLSAQEMTEGEPGSGILMRWQEAQAIKDRTVVHSIAFDDPSAIKSWETIKENNTYSIKSNDRKENWTLTVANDGTLDIKDSISGNSFKVSQLDGVWSLKDLKSKK